jgi:hypothetical protein
MLTNIFEIFNKAFFKNYCFYSGRDASHPEICFTLHSHNSCPRSEDCEGSRIRTWDYCVLSLVSPSCLNQLSFWYYIPPTVSYHIRL